MVKRAFVIAVLIMLLPSPMKASELPWWSVLRPGDILFTWDSAFPSREGRSPGAGMFSGFILYEHGHAGIYVGDGLTVEALGFNEGVVLRDVREWVTNYYGFSVLRVVTATDEQAEQAAQHALVQVGKPFKFLGLVFTKSSKLDQPSWYCSELVWGVYYNVGIDLELLPWGTVDPFELLHSPHVVEIGGGIHGTVFWYRYASELIGRPDSE